MIVRSSFYSFFILIIFLLEFLVSCRAKKENSSLERFYTKYKFEYLNLVKKFSEISNKETIAVSNVKGNLVIDRDKSHPRNIVIYSKRPTIYQNDSMRAEWYNLFYKINASKSQFDLDLLGSIQDVFQFYEQNALLGNFDGTKGHFMAEGVVVNKECIGRWCTLTNILEIKLSRRLGFYL